MSSITIDKLIRENVAPYSADHIGVYNLATNEKVGKIPLHSFKPYYPQRLYRFGILSDVHRQTNQQTDNAADLQRAFAFLNQKESVEFTVTCGDISQTGSTNDFQLYMNSVNTYSPDTSVYTTTGNHDCGTSGSSINDENWVSNIGTEKTFELTLHGDRFLFFGMNKWSFGDDGNPYLWEDIEWLESKLESYKNDRVFIITHLFFPQYAGNFKGIYPSYNYLGGEQLERLVGLANEYKNTIWFSGHSHWSLWLQDYDANANVQKAGLGGWTVHIPSCAVPIDSDGVSTRVELPGESEGVIVDVYDNWIDIRGIDIKSGKYIPIAQYRLITHKNISEIANPSYSEETYTNILPANFTVPADKHFINFCTENSLFDLNTQSLFLNITPTKNIANPNDYAILITSDTFENADIPVSISSEDAIVSYIRSEITEHATGLSIVYPLIKNNTTYKNTCRIWFFHNGIKFYLDAPYVRTTDHTIKIALSKNGMYINTSKVFDLSGNLGDNIIDNRFRITEWLAVMCTELFNVGALCDDHTGSHSFTYNSVRIYSGTLAHEQMISLTHIPEQIEEDVWSLEHQSYNLSSIVPGSEFELTSASQSNYVDFENDTVYFDLYGDLEHEINQEVFCLGKAIEDWGNYNLHIYYPRSLSITNTIELDFVTTGTFLRIIYKNIPSDYHIKLAINKNCLYINGELVINIDNEYGPNAEKDSSAGSLKNFELWSTLMLNEHSLRIGSKEGENRSYATYNNIIVWKSILTPEDMINLTKLN